MRLYWEVARRGFQRYSTYRGATLGGLFTNTVFGFMRVYVLLAVVRGRGEVAGYDATDAVTYVWLTQGLGAALDMWGRWDFVERVRTGEVAVDLGRPVDLQAWWAAQDAGRFGFLLLARAVPPVVVGAVAYGIRTPGSAALWVAFVVSVLLAEALAFAAAFAVGLTAFWLIDANGVQIMYGLSCSFFSGYIVPLNLFPGVWDDVARVLPFASMLQVPIDVFLGKFAGAGLLGVLGLQAAWIAVAIGVGRLVLGAATRKVVIQGG